jgi:uncharacterized protein (DUF488 family)
VTLLQAHQVQYVVDVRSRPYSGFRPEFSRDALEQTLRRSRIGYVYMGDTLGGQPNDPSCYTDGKVDYRKCRNQSWFQEGLTRLRTAWNRNVRVALMCSEAKPELCHRSKLIGQALVEDGITVRHIDEAGALKTQDDVIRTLTGGQLSLLDMPSALDTSRKVYRPQPG